MLGLARRGQSLVVSLRDSHLPGHVCTCPFLLQQSPFSWHSFRIVFSLLCSTTCYTYVRVLLRLSSSRVARSASRILDYRPLPTHCCCNVLRVLRYHVGRQRLLCKVTYTRDGASQVSRAVVSVFPSSPMPRVLPPYGSQYGLLYCGWVHTLVAYAAVDEALTLPGRSFARIANFHRPQPHTSYVNIGTGVHGAN